MMQDAGAGRRAPVCTVVGSNGQVARLVCGLLRARGWTVAGIDLAAHGDHQDAVAEYVQSDGRELTPAARDLLGTSAMAVLCLPQDVLLQALAGIAACLPAGALLVDTASIKAVVAQEAARLPRTDLELLGINPLFAPQLGFAGQGVGWVEYRPAGAGAAAFRQALESAGAAVVRLAPGQHDALCSLTQVLVHSTLLSFMAALRASGLPMEQLLSVATPPFRMLAGLAARMLGSPAHIYWDIQHANVEAQPARAALLAELARLDATARNGEKEAFEREWERLRDFLGGDADELRASIARALGGDAAATGASAPRRRG